MRRRRQRLYQRKEQLKAEYRRNRSSALKSALRAAQLVRHWSFITSIFLSLQYRPQSPPRWQAYSEAQCIVMEKNGNRPARPGAAQVLHDVPVLRCRRCL